MAQKNTLTIPAKKYMEGQVPSDLEGAVNSFLEIFGNKDLKQKQIPLGGLSGFYLSENKSLIARLRISDELEARLIEKSAPGFWEGLKRKGWLTTVKREDVLEDEVIFEVLAVEPTEVPWGGDRHETVFSAVLDIYLFRYLSSTTTYMSIERKKYPNPSKYLFEDAKAFRSRFLKFWKFEDVPEPTIEITLSSEEPVLVTATLDHTEWLKLFEERPESDYSTVRITSSEEPKDATGSESAEWLQIFEKRPAADTVAPAVTSPAEPESSPHPIEPAISEQQPESAPADATETATNLASIAEPEPTPTAKKPTSSRQQPDSTPADEGIAATNVAPVAEPASNTSTNESADRLQKLAEPSRTNEHSLNQTLTDKPEPVGFVQENLPTDIKAKKKTKQTKQRSPSKKRPPRGRAAAANQEYELQGDDPDRLTLKEMAEKWNITADSLYNHRTKWKKIAEESATSTSSLDEPA